MLTRSLIYLSLCLVMVSALRIGDGIAISDISLAAAMVSYTVGVVVRGGRGLRKIPKSAAWIIIGFLIYAAASYVATVNSESPAEAFVAAAQFAFIAAWIFISAEVPRNADLLRNCLLSVYISCVLTCAAAAGQYLGIYEPPFPPIWGRMTGLSRHPNELGGAAAIGVAIALGFLIYVPASFTSRSALLLGAAICFAGLLFSASISAAVSLMVVLILLCLLAFFFRTKKRRAPARRVLVGAMILFPCIGAVVGASGSRENSLLERLSMATDTTAKYSTVASRLSGYEEAFEKISRDPWIGQGAAATSSDGLGIHNIIIKAWFEAGLGGLFAALIIVGSAVFAGGSAVLKDGLRFPLLIPAAMSSAVFFVISLSSPTSTQRSSWVALILLVGALGALDCAKRADGSKHGQ